MGVTGEFRKNQGKKKNLEDPVWLEPRTPGLRVKHLTTQPRRTLLKQWIRRRWQLLSYGKGLNLHLKQWISRINPFPNKPWILRVCSTSLLKTLWEKEKLLVTGNFSFSHSVF